MKFDDTLSLEKLENEYWGEPAINSSLVKSCHRLRSVPVNKLTVGDITLLIRHKIGLKYLIPASFDILAESPFVYGTYFHGDLLKSILSVPKEFWDNNQDLFFELSEIIVTTDGIYRLIKNDIYPIWDMISSRTINLCDTTDDKEKLIRKYGLKLENGAWYTQKENSHKHLIFKESFVQRQDVIGLLFRINKLCMAKVKYFRSNINN